MPHAGIATFCLLLAPASALAQVDDAFTCVLGLYDDLQLSSCTGSFEPGIPKDIYVGIRFDPASGFDRLSGIEFSVAGIGAESGIIVVDRYPCDPWMPSCCDTPEAPADTSTTSTGRGGCYIAWSSCLTGDQALIRFTLLAFAAVHDKVLQIKPAYPTTSPAWHTPVFWQCDGPTFTPTRVTGGCYVVNPTGPLPQSCRCSPVAVEPASWAGLKTLFR